VSDNTYSEDNKKTHIITRIIHSVIGKNSAADLTNSLNSQLNGHLVEGEALQVKGMFEGAAHILTSPLRVLDWAVCDTGLLDCQEPNTAPRAPEILKKRNSQTIPFA
jgi:hypothetical protein